MVKNTRKKNIKYKTNKKKTKKVQVGGFSYDTWKNTIENEDNLDELNRFLTEINDNIDKVDIDKKDELINLINDKINNLSNNSQPIDTSESVITDNSLADESTIPSAPPIDMLNQNAIDIENILKDIPEDIQLKPEIATLIEQIKYKTATPEQIEQINNLTTQYKTDMQTKPTVESQVEIVDTMPVEIVDTIPVAIPLASNDGLDFGNISADEFVIKAPLSIKPQIMKVIEDNNCSVTTSIFDSNGNVASTN